jgi:diguanylate cyclase (GGDEF)-like protein
MSPRPLLLPPPLRFADERLEQRFRQFDQQKTRLPMQPLATVALVVTLLFAVVDLCFLDDPHRPVVLGLRALMAAAPALLAVLAPRLRGTRASFATALSLAVMGIADALIVAAVGPADRALYHAGVLVLLAMAYTAVPFGFRLSAAVALAISAADLAVLLSAHGEAIDHWVGGIYLLGINGAGMLAAYHREAMLRQHFLDHLVLQGEHRELIRMSRRLELLSLSDELTGLANRRELVSRIEGELAAVERGGGPAVLVLIDLDGFKGVNDRLGHAAGDDLLRLVAESLQDQVRRCDAVFRIGGDEFCVLMPRTSLGEAVRVVERILDGLAVQTADGGVDVGFSAGCAVTSGEDSVDSLLSRADVQLYRAKQSGGGRVCAEMPAMALRAAG